VNALDILKLLKSKHTKDLFVSGCKTGATWNSNYRILDAWVMRRSWTKPCIIGYEFKISRSDFLADDKWRFYLDYCNEFYFICPYKMISPEEVGENAGLIWVSKTGSRLFMKKKAPHRNVAIPESIFRYILMCRTKIEWGSSYKDEFNIVDSKREYWQNWLKQKDEDKKLGRCASRKIQQILRDEIEKVIKRNKTLEQQNAEYEDIKKLLSIMKIDINSYNPGFAVERKLEEIEIGLPRNLQDHIDKAMYSLVIIQDYIKKQKEREKPR